LIYLIDESTNSLWVVATSTRSGVLLSPYAVDYKRSWSGIPFATYHNQKNQATMNIMARFRANHEGRFALIAFCLALSLGLSQGCARTEPLHRSDTSSATNQQNVPFHSDTDQATENGRASATAAADPKLPASLPFRALHPRVLPAGTLLTVQLQNSLSAAKVHVGDRFTASVYAPLTIDNDTLIDRGAPVAGRIESARSLGDRQGRVPGSGYFRLTLNSITIEGRQLALQTSSLFARGTLQSSGTVGVQKGRPLTFRLTAPVTLDEPNSMANSQSSGPSTE